jgi:SAM-dependent methyltransferase
MNLKDPGLVSIMRTIPNRQGHLDFALIGKMRFEMPITPQLYQAHHGLHNEDLPFWLELAGRQKGPILELGCGTGRVLIALAGAGYASYGLDSDAGMLATLQHQARSDAASGCSVFQADMAAYHLAQAFALILLPCNTLSTLPAETRRTAFALIRHHLSPKGLFAASLPNPALLARLPRRAAADIEEIFSHPVDGEPVQVSSTWQRSAEYFTITWHYDHLLPDGRVERLTAQACHTMLPVEGYTDELGQAGLKIEALYGDFDQSSYTENSPNLIILAHQ